MSKKFIKLFISIPRQKTNTKKVESWPKYNTDGRVNKLVTVFAKTAPQINPAEFMYPDTRTCTLNKSCTVIDSCFRDSLYRDTAQVLTTKILYPDSFLAPTNLVPRHSECSLKLVP